MENVLFLANYQDLKIIEKKYFDMFLAWCYIYV